MASPSTAVDPPSLEPMSSSGVPTAEVMDRFLSTCIKMMQSDETRQLLRQERKPGLKLIELQRREWDPLGVNRDLGCRTLEGIEKLCPENTQLRSHRDEFVRTAQRTFLKALEDQKPKKLETKKAMPRETIVEFFDACDTKMDLPETREMLASHLRETNQVPNQLIIQLQRDMLEVFGFEQEHGCAMLSRVGQDFPNDHELHKRFDMWRRKAQSTCMMVVRQHQLDGGEAPPDLVGMSQEFQGLRDKAKEEIEAMTPKERGEFLQATQKKVEVFMNLPGEGKATYMKRLSEVEKIEFLKAQLLMQSVLQAQWRQQQQHLLQQKHQHEHQHQHGDGERPLSVTAPVVGTPQQQQMM